MLRFFVWSSCLVLFACGDGQVAKTTSVTDGSLVMGIVPLKSGDEGDYQRYRLLLCKKLPAYNAQVFADTSKCRSALYTKEGEEVDLVGKSLDAENGGIAHLDANMADDVREIGLSPFALINNKAQKDIVSLVAWVGGIGAAGAGVLAVAMGSTGYPGLALMVGGSGLILGIWSVTSLIQKAKKAAVEKGNDRFGHKRVLPQPTGCGGGLFTHCVPEYSRTDTMTSQNWYNIHAKDFRNITSLEKSGDVRSILVAMAKFYKLKVNESALQLENL